MKLNYVTSPGSSNDFAALIQVSCVVVKTINILRIYQFSMSATISKCEVCGQEFGTPSELDEHKRAKHQG
jgi:hypothetical protein